MHSSQKLITFLLLFLCSIFASGLPTTDLSERSLVKRYDTTKIRKVEDGKTSGYDDDAHIRAGLSLPGSSKFVFYAAVGQSSDKPDSFARSIGAKTLNMAAPPLYFEDDSKPGFENFVDRASGIYAELAEGEIFFLGPWDKKGVVEPCRVWTRMELPTIIAAGRYTKITLVNPDNFNERKDITQQAIVQAITTKLTKDFKACNDWDGYGGIPKSGKNHHTDYKPGNCGLHFTQYQKNEGPGKDTSVYRYTIEIKDNEGEIIGSVKEQGIANGATYGLTSALPYVLLTTSGKVDSDDPVFKYGSWTSSRSSCSIGGYDSGSRQGDCGFSCPAK